MAVVMGKQIEKVSDIPYDDDILPVGDDGNRRDQIEKVRVVYEKIMDGSFGRE